MVKGKVAIVLERLVIGGITQKAKKTIAGKYSIDQNSVFALCKNIKYFL